MDEIRIFVVDHTITDDQFNTMSRVIQLLEDSTDIVIVERQVRLSS